MNKNHEGYHDPTASEAIGRAYRQQKKKGNKSHLMYHVGEASGFQEVKKRVYETHTLNVSVRQARWN